MRCRLVSINLLLTALFLALVPTALASAKWYVDGVNGNDNNNCKSRQHACKTIGHAISLASSGDSIKVAAATYRENLTIAFSLKIVGSGAATTIIDGGGVNTVVQISKASAHVTLSKLTITHGSAQFGGGINNSGTLTISKSSVSGNIASGSNHASGGGIYNIGTVRINNSALSDNTVSAPLRSSGGAITNDVGGGLVINNSTLSGNTASGGGFRHPTDGGGISNSGGLQINKSTLSTNKADSGGGMDNLGAVTINNSTFSGNSAIGGGGIYTGGGLTISSSTFNGNSATGSGGGISCFTNCDLVTLQDDIVANNSGGNCNNTVTSNGYNLSSDNTCNFNNTGDLNNTDPRLGKLGNYGGPTQTIPLLSGSPAIDAGNPGGCTDGQGHLLKTDQRGKPRPDKEDTGGCDMGAYERQKD